MASSSEVDGNVERMNLAELARLVRERRGALSLRQAAAEAEVSFSTLTRVEDGSQPDLASFMKLCAWLGLPPSQFFTPVVEREVPPIERAIAQLNTDPRLTAQSASLIAGLLTQMYEQLAQEEKPREKLLACHLRAAPIMRPGVPHRLGSLLFDLHEQLETLVAAGEL